MSGMEKKAFTTKFELFIQYIAMAMQIGFLAKFERYNGLDDSVVKPIDFDYNDIRQNNPLGVCFAVHNPEVL